MKKTCGPDIASSVLYELCSQIDKNSSVKAAEESFGNDELPLKCNDLIPTAAR